MGSDALDKFLTIFWLTFYFIFSFEKFFLIACLMDASFDQFGGYGWGEQSGGGGGQDFNIPTPFQKSHITDKIPIPAIVEDLLTMSNDEEKYVIGGYSFNTVCLNFKRFWGVWCSGFGLGSGGSWFESGRGNLFFRGVSDF
ncbi:unnamed protein product [Meloidogyne enterolobii]|uniref:Uncharacterized protein n=1 Tax=Meloidogyne enterolobii TaxID=390850 RepID=A0ACB1AXL2_MELEN